MYIQIYLLIFIFKICAHLFNLVYTFKETVTQNSGGLKVNTSPQMFYNSVRDVKCSKMLCHIEYSMVLYSVQCVRIKRLVVHLNFLELWGIRHPQSLYIQYFLQKSHEECTQLVLASLCKTDSNKSWLLNRTYCSSEFTRIVNKTLIHIVIWPMRFVNHV